jgi:outer membrane protein assembly factor BamB
MHPRNRFFFGGLMLMVSCVASSYGREPARVAVASSPYWPQWRGAGRDDLASDKGLLRMWPDGGPRLVWTGTGLGDGYASVAIDNGRIYTLGDREDGEYLICLDDLTGKEAWSTRIGERWKDGGARSTPAVGSGGSGLGAEQLVYALTPNGDLVCVAAKDGSLKWQKNLAKDFGGKMMSGWGFSESPLVDGDRLICTPGSDDAAVVALDRFTGDKIWAAKIEDCGGAGYSSIVKTKAGGVEQYVTVLGKKGGAVGVRAKDGKLLWQHTGVAGKVANIPTPIVRDDYVFYTTGYDDGGSALLKIVSNGDELKAEEVWTKDANDLRNHHGGVVLVGDYLYGGHGQNNGFPFCVNFLTGESVWPRKRGPGDRSAAVTYADGRLYFRYEDGTMALIEANPVECKIVSTFKIPEGSRPSWAHPVVAGGRLYLRDKDRLLCYDVRDPGPASQARGAAVPRKEVPKR